MSKRPNRKSVPKTPVAALIESFAHDLRGVAHVNGKAVFVDGALPGEEVEFVYTDIRRDYAEARVA
ncbi:MAG: TRAM domain-containing protein, partial [Candidatus Methylumidiphilus sp.]